MFGDDDFADLPSAHDDDGPRAHTQSQPRTHTHERGDRGRAYDDRRDGGRPGDDRGPRRRREEDFGPLPALHSIHRGEVVRLAEYGAFVRLDGFARFGMVHVSQLSSTRVERPEDVVAVGDSVYVKVIAVDEAARKISLSMKVVAQTDGKDLDPMNLEEEKAARSKSRAAGGGAREEAPESRGIVLGAVYNTACTKCGGRGHMAFECFSGMSGGKKYELVLDDTRPPPPRPLGPPPQQAHAPLPAAAAGMSRAPVGRGRAMTMPAWMTQQAASGRVPGADASGPQRTSGDRYERPQERSRYSRSRSSSSSASSYSRLRDRRRIARSRRSPSPERSMHPSVPRPTRDDRARRDARVRSPTERDRREPDRKSRRARSGSAGSSPRRHRSPHERRRSPERDRRARRPDSRDASRSRSRSASRQRKHKKHHHKDHKHRHRHHRSHRHGSRDQPRSPSASRSRALSDTRPPPEGHAGIIEHHVAPDDRSSGGHSPARWRADQDGTRPDGKGRGHRGSTARDARGASPSSRRSRSGSPRGKSTSSAAPRKSNTEREV